MEAVIDFFTPARCIELLGLLTGLCYLWFEYHANPLVWLVGIVMPMISMWVYFTKGLYADFGINIYYLVMAVYGYVAWTFNFRKKTKQELPVSRLTLRVGISLAVVAALLWALLAWILIAFTDSTVPYADAFTTALSIVGMWMMARKIAEQWLVWFIVDVVCVALYIYKGIYFYAGLYTAYTIVSLLGYRKWLRMIPAFSSVR